MNLDVRSKDQHMLRSEIGLKWEWNLCKDCYVATPYLGISWVGEFPLNDSKQEASFLDQTPVFEIPVYDSSNHLASPEVGLIWNDEKDWSLIIGYKGLFNDKTRISQAELRLERNF